MIKIGTHSGKFHADEALACFFLKSLPEYASATIVRSRDPTVHSTMDVLVDVGGIYDPSTHRYDHHQREFKDTFSQNHSIKLSSAGLVYKHFGEKVIANSLNIDICDARLKTLYLKLYNSFVMPLDAIDNGIESVPEDVLPLYKDSTTLAARIGRLNSNWNEPDNDDERFLKAIDVAGEEFTSQLFYYANAWLPARELVVEALKNRFNVHESGKILCFEVSCPWKEHLLTLEEELNIEDKPFYVLYPDNLHGQWRIQAIPIREGSFLNRCPLPENWRGLRFDDLDKITSIEGGVFVHASGFIGGHKTKDGALQLAILASRMKDNKH
ncbi:GAMM1 protein [Rozella allomycis CSF55]|uniref:GAMM1 protein n=1 Tax=Rozella allomycis (strain CSF55) TaxID=988480 RepID=A0A075B4R1_ROZAC|nr:Metal-dependent protein hydrolase domain-containing protein [Rozella allomycis CSF55]RKP20784.1 GAMM1 protein [Rozella allomycis CSF55]|eukprot:EPZ36554.1 Metal-dependent protein hydrolase domain-containing protein [Rozella allomycis CSF55]